MDRGAVLKSTGTDGQNEVPGKEVSPKYIALAGRLYAGIIQKMDDTVTNVYICGALSLKWDIGLTLKRASGLFCFFISKRVNIMLV